jgi:glycosyltransferase involved in cell wall biosynthesis
MCMAPPPLISVVIPCYNQGHFLADAIGSISNNSPSLPVEIIVVDDGSSDDTAKRAERFPGVRYTHQANAGLAAARNAGLRTSGGAFIVFLDADDMLAAGALDVGAATLASHPDCAFVTGRCVMMDAGGALQPTPYQPRVTGDPYEELLRHNYIWMPAMAMFRREAVVEAGGFDADVNAAADYALYLRIARQWPVYDHGKVVAYYRQHDANMSANAARMLRETLKVHDRERSRAAREPSGRDAFREGRRRWQEFYGTRLVEEIRAHVRAREWRSAASKAMILARYHPRGLTHHGLRKMRLWITRRHAAQGLA